MENNIEKLMLPFKIQQILEIIIQKRSMNLTDAMLYLYSSELYKQLSAEDSYLWQLSALNLYDLLKKEKRESRHDNTQSAKVILFLSHTIENYKNHTGKTAEEVVLLFNKYGVINYLTDFFDSLHTQSDQYVISEIETFINNRIHI